MAKSREREAEPQVASLNPDEFLSGGLKDDFRGTITEAVYAPWDYDGNISDPVLAVRMTIKVEDEEEPFVQHWSAGNLDAFVPSQDGKTPCEEGEVGPYALKVGHRSALNNNTNFAHLLGAIIDAGAASKKFDKSALTASLECLEGIDAHWNRVPQKKRAGLVPTETEGKRSGGRDVLVVTEVFGYRENKKAAKGGAKGGSSAPEKAKGKAQVQEAGGESLDERLSDALVEIISTAGGTIRKSKLAPLVLKAFAIDKDKSKAVMRCTQAEFLEQDDAPWTYDEDEGTLSI